MFNFLTNFYRSPKWSAVRKEHLKYQPACQACGRLKDVEVHHIEPFHINPSKELDPSNLITLCAKPCHLVFGHLMDYKSWNPNVVGDCANYKQKLQQRPYHENFNQKPINFNMYNIITSFFWWNN